MKLDGMTALVTGAGRGIGRAIALRLARDGADIAVVDIELAIAEETAAHVRATGRRSLALELDVSDADATARTVDATIEEWGHIDILVNNAGIVGARPIVDFDEAEWRRMFDVNLHGAIRLCQLCGRHMTERTSGKIVNIASEAAKTVRPFMALYAATKMGLLAVTRGLAQELAPHGINVNAVCPGIVHTEMWEELDASLSEQGGVGRGDVLEGRKRSIPLGRLATPEDVAGAVSFLVSEDASYITGQALNVTGGREQH